MVRMLMCTSAIELMAYVNLDTAGVISTQEDLTPAFGSLHGRHEERHGHSCFVGIEALVLVVPVAPNGFLDATLRDMWLGAPCIKSMIF